MKSTLTLCAFLLSGSMFVAAQQPATSSSSPQAGTPPTFPTDQQTPSANEPQKSTLPDTSATQSTTQSSSVDQDSATPKTIEGCLSQASSGSGYTLTDASGIAYNLQGDSSLMSSHIGQQVSVTGQLTKTTASSSTTNTDNPDSKSSASTSASDSHSMKSDSVINVSKLDKVADSCSNQQAPVGK
jgi:hypothetical protein